jgi:hypothetical protein
MNKRSIKIGLSFAMVPLQADIFWFIQPFCLKFEARSRNSIKIVEKIKQDQAVFYTRVANRAQNILFRFD